MTSVKAWQDQLASIREKYIGGDFEEHANPEGAFRGPIKNIEIVDGNLLITNEWCAHLEGNRWVAHNNSVATYRLYSCTAPRYDNTGRLSFSHVGDLIIFFGKDAKKLERSEVRGLN